MTSLKLGRNKDKTSKVIVKRILRMNHHFRAVGAKKVQIQDIDRQSSRPDANLKYKTLPGKLDIVCFNFLIPFDHHFKLRSKVTKINQK